RKVVAVSGDGGFLMNCQELETARRLGLAVVNVIFRDDAYNLIQWKQQTRFGRTSGIGFSNPDFVALAHAFGAQGYRVEAALELFERAAQAPVVASRLGHDQRQARPEEARVRPREEERQAQSVLRHAVAMRSRLPRDQTAQPETAQLVGQSPRRQEARRDPEQAPQ